MNRIIQYKVERWASMEMLEDQVNYHIRRGWQPIGGIQFSTIGDFAQAMVRYADAEENPTENG